MVNPESDVKKTMKKSIQILVFKDTISLRRYDAACTTIRNICGAGTVSQGYRKEIWCRMYIGQIRYPTKSGTGSAFNRTKMVEKKR